VADDQLLFEHLTLDSQQAGISWLIILQKRENYRRALADFTPKILAGWGERELEGLVQDAGIVRNRAKLGAVLHNARKFLELQSHEGSFAKYLWQWVYGRPVIGQWERLDQVPAKTELSDAISQDLKKRGFKFIGSVSVYAFLQAVGVVNDHLLSCPRHLEVQAHYPGGVFWKPD
jgi:DNA-3-methyladenine glycosylase I